MSVCGFDPRGSGAEEYTVRTKQSCTSSHEKAVSNRKQKQDIPHWGEVILSGQGCMALLLHSLDCQRSLGLLWQHSQPDAFQTFQA
ncbi:hypothetical protein ABBQ38_012406 [Trebouxia sp. C0009 RCD-2024]